jgi:hypothetical protein
MSLHEDVISDASIAMMRRVLCNECARRRINPDSIKGEDLARVIMHAFRSGMAEECELTVLVRNLVD